MSIPLFGQVANKTHVITPAGAASLSMRDVCVLLILANGERMSGGWYYIGYSLLAYYCRTSKRKVVASIARLEKWGVLAVKKSEKGGPGAMNGYRVLTDKLIFHDTRKRGSTGEPQRGSTGEPQRGSTGVLVTSTPPSTPTKEEVGSSVPSPNLVEAGPSDRSIERKARRKKKGKAESADEEEIRLVLVDSEALFDGMLPRSILSAARSEDPLLSCHDLVRLLVQVLPRQSWALCESPAAVLTAAVREAVHVWKLRQPEKRSSRPWVCTCGRRGKCAYCHSLSRLM